MRAVAIIALLAPAAALQVRSRPPALRRGAVALAAGGATGAAASAGRAAAAGRGRRRPGAAGGV